MNDPGLEAVRRAIHARGVELSAVDVAAGFVVDHSTNGPTGSVSVFRPPATANEPTTNSPGDPEGLTYEFSSTAAAVTDAPKMLDEVVRKRRRQAVIDARGEPDEHPSWSVVVPKLFKDLVDADGGDLAEWPTLWNVAYHPQAQILANPSPRVAVQSLLMNCGRIHGSFKMRVDGMEDVLVSISNMCSIRLAFTQVPETVIAACVGEPIGCLIGHPMLEDVDVPILDVVNVDRVTKHVWVRMPYLPVPIVDAPDGMKRDWLPLR